MFRVLYYSLCITALTLAQAAQAQDVMAQDIMTLIKERQGQATEAHRIAPQYIPYSYLVSMNVSEDTDEGESVLQTVQYRVNPQAEAGSRITLVSGTLETLPEEARDEIEAINIEKTSAELAAEFWCNSEDDDLFEADDFEVDVDEAITVISDNDTEAVLGLDIKYLMGILAEGGEDQDMPKKLVKRLAAEVTVTKPDLDMKSMRCLLYTSDAADE